MKARAANGSSSDAGRVSSSSVSGLIPLIAGKRYGLAVDPAAKVADISVGAQQRVEILKTLYRGADILIFDEPTAVLTPSEIDELMAIMKNLVKEGKSIILITHKLDEIRAVSNRVTVIRRGKSIQTVEIAGATNADLAEMMVGRSVSFKTEKQAPQPKEVVLSIKDLVVNENRGVPAVKSLSLDVRAGEIVGIAGIDGNGQSELIQAITGLRKVESGSVELKGKSIVGMHPRQITELDKNGFDKVELYYTLGEMSYRSDMSAPAILNVIELAKKFYPQGVSVLPTTAGTGPMHTVFDALEVPMVAFGLGNANSRDHGGDENVRIADYYTHIELVEELIRSYE